MRKLLVAFVAALCAVALTPAASGASTGLSLSPAKGARFPERSFLLTLPERAKLEGSQASATENGEPVEGLTVEGLDAAARGKLGVVLAIDASTSMRGRPLAGALAAARDFTKERQGDQPLALMTFARRPRVLLPFSTDPFEIRSALRRSARVSGGTHIYDAARQGVEQIRRARLPGGFVVVLSDGGDRGSSVTAAQTAQAAKAAHARVYTVGLRSGSFEAGPLKQLAAATGGKYSSASSTADLRSIYTALGSELSNAYVVRYRSLEGPGRPVEVRVQVEGVGSAGTSYTTPKLSAATSRPVDSGGWWSSPAAFVLASLLVAGLLGLALATLLWPRRESLRGRVAQFVSSEEGKPGSSPGSRPGRVLASAAGSLSGARPWRAFERECDVAGFGWSAPRLFATVGAGTLVLAMVMAAAVPVAAAGPLLLAGPVLWLFVHSKAQARRREFQEQLADHLAVVGGAMSAGQSLAGALAAVVDDAPEPTRREFTRVVADVQLGAALEDALDRLAKRMHSRDVEQVAMLAAVQRQTGSNTSEMLSRVVETIRERQELTRTVRTLTAQGRLSRWILSLLPLVVLVILTVLNPTFMEPLYQNSLGHVLIGVGVAMVAAGSLIIGRIVNFEI